MQSSNNVSEQVLNTLRQIIRAIDIQSKYLSKNFGLTGPQLVAMREIALDPYITIGELARRVSLSQATVTTIIDRLEVKKLVTRYRSEVDKRKVILQVTGEGEKLLAANPTFLQEEFVQKFEALEEWEKTLILSSIQRLAVMMRAPEVDRHAELEGASLEQAAALIPVSSATGRSE
jgi:DNA-binding MarR family transcriptional regulator